MPPIEAKECMLCQTIMRLIIIIVPCVSAFGIKCPEGSCMVCCKLQIGFQDIIVNTKPAPADSHLLFMELKSAFCGPH